MNNILDGLKVIDCTQILAGPFCTMMLGDMGAEIIKVEKPNGGDDICLLYTSPSPRDQRGSGMAG